VPSYVYFALYGVTNACGDSFMECNRLLNNAFFVAASPFIYLLARRVAVPWLAVLVALAAALAPANALTPYFMPEAPYYFWFWVLCWAMFRAWERPETGRAALLGALLGIGAMVKLHAIFLLPGVALFLAYAAATARAERPGWLVRAVLLCAAMGAAFAVARFGIGYLLAGRAGLHLFGELYATHASYTATSHLPYPQLALLALNNLRGHLMMLALLYGVPVAILVTQLAAAVRERCARDPSQALAVLTFLMLGSVLGVTVVFTASITGLGEQEVASRIHTRYYHFALPLLLLCAVGVQRELALPWRAAVGAVVLAFVAYGKWKLLQYYTPAIVDSPELLTISIVPAAFTAIAVLGAAVLLAWIARPALGTRLFLYAFLPLATLYCAAVTAKAVRMSNHADTYTKAGLFARHFLDRAATDRLVIVGEAIGGLHRTRFFIENPNTALLEAPAGGEPDWAKLPPQAERVLVIGKYPLPEGARVENQLPDIALARLDPALLQGRILKFSAPLPAALVASSTGISGAEPWGAWTDGPRVTIRFAAPLPKRFRLTLAAKPFGPNAGETVVVTAGSARQELVLKEGTSISRHVFETDGTADTLEIAIPRPTTPASLGINPDQRALGLGLETLRIDPRPDKP
jgi:phosphoglycerol transferase